MRETKGNSGCDSWSDICVFYRRRYRGTFHSSLMAGHNYLAFKLFPPQPAVHFPVNARAHISTGQGIFKRNIHTSGLNAELRCKSIAPARPCLRRLAAHSNKLFLSQVSKTRTAASLGPLGRSLLSIDNAMPLHFVIACPPNELRVLEDT